MGTLTLCLVPKGSKPPTAQAQCSHLAALGPGDAARSLATSHACFSKLPPWLVCLFIVLVALGLCRCTRAFPLVVEIGGFSCCGAQVRRHVGFSSCGTRALDRRLSSCGAGAQFLHGMWDLPGPGIEPASPALAGDSYLLSHRGNPRSLTECSEIWMPEFKFQPSPILAAFSSVALSSPTLCDPMDCSTPGLPVHLQLPEFTQTHVHGVGDAIQPSHFSCLALGNFFF